MDDARVWEFEKTLWTGDPATYRDRISDECLMVVPAAPFLLHGAEAAKAMADTPRWDEVAFDEARISRPEEGLIVIAYRVTARRDGSSYDAYCTSTLRRRGHEDWQVVQHQQTPPPVAPAVQGPNDPG